MKPNVILDEIYRTRDEIMRECDYDLDRLFAAVKREERAAAAGGERFVSLEKERHDEKSAVVREEPPKHPK
jgi:ATP phosphoribosyltransferase regulatory subunit HisZ